MRIPLKNQLRGSQASMAQLQDEALEIMYAVEPEAVLRGGTAIWRCYNGKRFSEDLDFYAPKSGFAREALEEQVARHGLSLTKFRKTENNVYARISNGRTEVSIEAALRQKKGRVLAAFEKADGSTAEIYTLEAEELLLEKAAAFASRKLIRDIYDVYFLSGIADLAKVKKELHGFLYGKIPLPADEKNLRTLIYSGPCPSFNEMVNALKRRAGHELH